MTEEWLHRTMSAARELDETGVWQKLDWDERERLIAKLIQSDLSLVRKKGPERDSQEKEYLRAVDA